MQFRLSAPGDCNKFFCVCVISKNKGHNSHCENFDIPDIKTLYQTLKISPTTGSCCPESTLFVISSKKPLNFKHFENIVRDIVKYNLKATFAGAKKENCFCVPPSSICACANEIICAPNCLKPYLSGTCVFIKDRCIKETMKQKLNDLAKQHKFMIIYSKKCCQFKPENKMICPKNTHNSEGAFKKVWSEWKNCENDMQKWNRHPCETVCHFEQKHCHTPSHKPCKTSCHSECNEEEWVKETWTPSYKQSHHNKCDEGHKKQQCHKSSCDWDDNCHSKNFDDFNWDDNCDWNQNCHKKSHCHEDWGNDCHEGWDEGCHKKSHCHEDWSDNCHKKSHCHENWMNDCHEGWDEGCDWSKNYRKKSSCNNEGWGDKDWDEGQCHKKNCHDNSNSFFNWI